MRESPAPSRRFACWLPPEARVVMMTPGMTPPSCRFRSRAICSDDRSVVPGLTGWVDYGSYRFVRPLKGSFGIIDETEETHGPEASTTGICLVPSVEALVWIMQRIGFARVEVLPVPADGYEQLVHRKRVMVAGWV